VHSGPGRPALSLNPAARPDDQGNFQLTGVRGYFTLRALVPGRAAVRAMKIDGREVTGQVLRIDGTELVDDVSITVTTNLGAVDGTVPVTGRDLLGIPTVVLVPVNSVQRQAGLQLRSLPPPTGRSEVPGRNGATTSKARVSSFLFSAVLPGRYFVLAVDRFPRQDGELTSQSGWLDAALARATILTVTHGATVHVALPSVIHAGPPER
jgi:hypothetical protein